MSKIASLLYEAIRELQYVQDASCGSTMCASSNGKSIIERGMEALGVKDLAEDELPSLDGKQGLIWVIEVTYKRKPGKPTEAVAITTGGMLQAIVLAEATAQAREIPRSWVSPVLYKRCTEEK